MARRGYGFGEFSGIYNAMISMYSIILMRLPWPGVEYGVAQTKPNITIPVDDQHCKGLQRFIGVNNAREAWTTQSLASGGILLYKRQHQYAGDGFTTACTVVDFTRNMDGNP
ncbi:MAG: hypothetical protein RL711_1114 [Bacteroidota bacterium]